jgi:hypothetical protein
MPTRKLGDRTPSYNPNRLFIAKYIDRSTVSVPTLPVDMSVAPLIVANPWIMSGMLLNGPDDAAVAVLMAVFGIDQATAQAIATQGLGDCFYAAAVRRAAIAAASVGKLLWTSYADMLKAALLGYTSTGWNPKNSAQSDQGTDPTQGFAQLKATGLLCSDGSYDKQTIQLGVNPADFEELMIAFNLSAGNMSFGINFPSDYESAKEWGVSTGAIVGGHQIAGYSNLIVTPRGIKIDSWGEEIDFTDAGIAQNCSQCTVILSPDQFGPGGTNIAGFDSEQMLANIQVTA